MRPPKGYRTLASIVALTLLAGCSTNRILKCEGHLVPINPPPPKPAMGAAAPAQKPESAGNAGHKP